MNKLRWIDWVDYYKAIAIILVVLGHATGKFNPYIYQFHIAAFFFISGFVSNIEKKGLDEILITKFCSLILPFAFFAVLGVSLFSILQNCGYLHYVSSFESIPRWVDCVSGMFSALYCDWLGATWFLPSLFAAIVISKLCLIADCNRYGVIFAFASIFVFRMGYFYHYSGQNPVFFTGLAHYCIVQFFFSMGAFFRGINERNEKTIPKTVFICLTIISLLFFRVIKDHLFVMDLASTSVNSPLVDALMATNGIMLLICVSHFFMWIPFDGIKHLIRYIGRNTFGILIFHFIGFKLAGTVLCILKVCDWNMISNLTPPGEISDSWWPFYLVVATSFSLFTWNIMNKSKIIRFLSGSSSESYKLLYKKYKGLFEK